MLEIKEIKIENVISKEEILKNKDLFFAKNGKPIVVYSKWKNNKVLNELLSSLLFYTSFIKEDKFLLGLRIHCVENNINEYPTCKCGNTIIKIWNNLKFNKFCCQSCANKYTNYEKEGVYGEEMSKRIWNTRRKNGKGLLTTEHKRKLSIAHKTKETKDKFKKTCLAKYGVENPGVLGAYFSKAGEKYIKQFIKDNNINESDCYFKNGGKNGNEYFQMIYDEDKKKQAYFSYDFVVLKENKIELVLEYNGPWHYTEKDILIDPNGPATPYKNNKLTKKETYLKDKLKLNYIDCDNILIFWEQTNKLEKYEKSY
jgi:hypothetical protein